MRVRSSAVVTEPLFWRLTKDSYTAGEVRKRVKQLGLTHHLHNFVSADFRGVSWFAGPVWNSRQLAIYTQFIRSYCRPVYRSVRADNNNGSFYGYEYEPRPALKAFPVYFVPSTEGRFRDERFLRVNGVLEPALKELDALGGEMQDSCELQLERGKILNKMERYKEAYRELAAGIKQGFVTDTNMEEYGWAAMNIGRYEEGLEATRREMEITGSAASRFRLGVIFYRRGLEVYFNKGRYVPALADFTESSAMMPLEPAPRVYAALCLEKLGRIPEALETARGVRRAGKTIKEIDDLIDRLTKAASRKENRR
jgi:tetratricopeptide (TPR) repeat protein